MILKSTRLREVDFSDSQEISAVRFLSSSAAHTFASLRYYPQATAVGRPSRSRPAESRPASTITSPQPPTRRNGPKLGIFYDNRYRHHSSQRSSFEPAVPTLRRSSGHSVSTVGSPVGIDNSGLQSPTSNSRPVVATSPGTGASQGDAQLGVARRSAARGIASRLPPPLTTRAASKRQAATLSGFAATGASASQDVATSAQPRAKSRATPVP